MYSLSTVNDILGRPGPHTPKTDLADHSKRIL